MAKLVEMAKPLSSAKYVRMETFMDKSMAPGQKQRWYPWPYVEGVTMAEATNELDLPRHRRLRQADRQAARRAHSPGGAVEVRLQARSSRSCASPSPTSGRRASGRSCRRREYGFWANVNPEVPHPRWSQATEEVIGTGERRPTMLYNGYGEYVAGHVQGPRRRAALGLIRAGVRWLPRAARRPVAARGPA